MGGGGGGGEGVTDGLVNWLFVTGRYGTFTYVFKFSPRF